MTKHSKAAMEMAEKIVGYVFPSAVADSLREQYAAIIDEGMKELVEAALDRADVRIANEAQLATLKIILARYEVPK